jgi:hypothetical protein
MAPCPISPPRHPAPAPELADGTIDAPPVTAGADAAERARQLARSIAADLAADHGVAFAEWLAAGPPGSLAERPLPPSLRRGVEEGRRLVAAGAGTAVDGERDFMAEALLELAAERSRG